MKMSVLKMFHYCRQRKGHTGFTQKPFELSFGSMSLRDGLVFWRVLTKSDFSDCEF